MNLIPVIFLGLLCAALVNYLSDVLPVKRRLAAHTCPNCQADFNLLNYLTFTPCRVCGTRRSLRAYLVLASGAAAAFIVWNWPPEMGFSLALLILTYFGVVAVIDIEHRLIMHAVSLAGGILFAIVGTLLHGWQTTLLGGLAGGGVMLLFYLIGTRFAKYRARKLGNDDEEEALGFGDVTISTVLGLLVGFPSILLTLLIGVLLGGLFSLLVIVVLSLARRYDPLNVFTAYGPFLLIGAIVMLFFRDAALRFFFGG
jgi:prepilin signal peptidase PulO-like enzyme (type II secretory pathway)